MIRKTAAQQLVIVAVLVLVVTPAKAGWEFLGTTDTATYFIDPTTIRKDGDRRKVWIIYDLNSPDDAGVLSRRAQEEFNCKLETRKTLFLSAHSGRQAEGKTIISFVPTPEERPIPPGTILEVQLKFVCAR